MDIKEKYEIKLANSEEIDSELTEIEKAINRLMRSRIICVPGFVTRRGLLKKVRRYIASKIKTEIVKA